MERRLAPARQTVDLANARLERGVVRLVERRRERLGALSGRLHALSPLAILERGYSVARTGDGTLLRRVADLPAGKAFELRVADGSVGCVSNGRLEAREEGT
jgi:exodeoxyribonuclease VII large subunit